MSKNKKYKKIMAVTMCGALAAGMVLPVYADEAAVKDENVYAQIDEWIEDFISQAPPAKRDEIRQLIKENTEII